ncbi:glycerophosphodiester phosphodiesterase 1-like [Synchiropus splendidus]|uniref:glycerophosphodiester phosphodiesterase 1-like n=1 Tax=Synchiropus splendidus TaxID=270530 RepID=UPI00237EAA70|nr:glycerophosphodiester phosphodiesterase 1-like [Synchiropus splendidus]
MLQIGDELLCFSAAFLLVVFVTRSPSGATLVTGLLYVFMLMFRFSPVPTEQAALVLRPRARAGGVPVVAHRGGSHDAPENTLAAIREASRNGATAVELDLSFTADGVPVLMHDDSVDRTTNGSGLVQEMKYSQLKRLNAAAHHRLKQRFGVEKVPTLQEAVVECVRHHLTIIFDVKGQPDKAARSLHHIYTKFPSLYNSSLVSSFEPKVIYKMRQTDPSVVTALTHRPWRLSRFNDGTPRSRSSWVQLWMALLDVLLDWAHHHILWRLCGVSAVLVQKDFISQDYVEYWSDRGVEVLGWTVNSAVEKSYYQNQLKIGFITDSLVEDCDPQY